MRPWRKRRNIRIFDLLRRSPRHSKGDRYERLELDEKPRPSYNFGSIKHRLFGPREPDVLTVTWI